MCFFDLWNVCLCYTSRYSCIIYIMFSRKMNRLLFFGDVGIVCFTTHTYTYIYVQFVHNKCLYSLYVPIDFNVLFRICNGVLYCFLWRCCCCCCSLSTRYRISMVLWYNDLACLFYVYGFAKLSLPGFRFTTIALYCVCFFFSSFDSSLR